jgi:hypothetical protein
MLPAENSLMTLSLSIARLEAWLTNKAIPDVGRFGHWIVSSRKTFGISAHIFYSRIS